MADEILETLAVRIIAETDGLREALDNAVKDAKDKVKELEAALSLDLTGLRQQLEGALNISDAAKGAAASLTETGDAAKAAGVEVARAFDGVSADALADEIRKVNKQMRDLDAQLKAGSVSRDEWRAETQRLRAEMQELWAAANKGRTELPRVAAAQQELTDKIKDLSTQVRTARNLWAARVTDDAEFTRSTQALHNEMSVLASTADLTNEQMRQLTQGMAFAQRGLDSAAGAASRGGLAWTAQIAVANQFGQQLRNLGPVGMAAASALGIVSGGGKQLAAQFALTTVSVKGLTAALTALARSAPLILATLAVGGVTALTRMSRASVEAAASLDTLRTQTGMSAEALQEYGYAAEQAGVSSDRFSSLMGSLQRRMGRAADGNERYVRAFEQLGVSVRDASGNLRSVEDVLPELADGFKRVTNETDRARLATTIMNNAGTELLPLLVQGADSIDEFRARAQELGIVLSGAGVDALVEYDARVREVKAQFQGVRDELSAALLPLLSRVLLPLVQQHLIPAFQSVANRVSEFMLRLQETGHAGDTLRTRIMAWVAPVVRFGYYIRSAGLALQGLGQIALGVVASVGAFIGDLSVQIATFARSIAQIQEGLEWWQRGDLTGAVTFFRRVGEIEWPSFGQAGRSAANAFQRYFDDAMNSWAGSDSAFASGMSTSTESLARDFHAMLQDAGMQHGDNYATAFGDEFEDIIPSVITDALARGTVAAIEDPKVKQALEDLALSGMARAVDGPLYSSAELAEAEARLAAFTAAFEREEARRTRVAEYAEAERTASAERNAARHRQLQEAMTAALDKQLRERALLVTQLQPDEGVAGSGRAAAGRTASANARIAAGAAADAAAARTAERYREARQAAQEWDAQLTALADGMAAIDREAALFGETSGTLNARIALQRQHVLWLAQEYPEAAQMIAAARAELEHLETALEQLNRIPGVEFVETLKSGITEIQGLSDRVAAVIGTAPSEVEALTAALEGVRERGGLAAAAASALLAQLKAFEGAAPDRALAAMREELAGAAAEARVFGTETELAGAQAAILEGTIRVLIPLLGEESDTVRELTAEYRALKAEQEAREATTAATITGTLNLTESLQQLVKSFSEGNLQGEGFQAALSVVSSNLRGLGGAVGGVGGEILEFGANVADVAVKAIQGDWVGAILTAITTLFDFSNGLKEIQAQVDQMAASGRYAGRALIQGFADANTTQVRRSGVFGWFGATKAAIDAEAVQLAVSMAESVGSAMASAFSATDIQGFHRAWTRGLDKVIEQEIINGFILGEAAQTQIATITQAILDGNYSRAERLFRDLEASAEVVWRALDKWREPVEKVVDSTREWRRMMGNIERLTNQVREAELGRSFEQGAIGIQRYATQLAKLREALVKAEYMPQIRELEDAINQAWYEGDRNRAYDLEGEMRALTAAYRDALVQGAWEAEQEIRGILGTGMDTLQSDLRSAFDVTTTEDFTEAFAKNLRATTRNALRSGFLESEAVKPLLEELSSGLTTAVLTGDFSAATLAGLQGTVDEITHVSTTFFDMLDKLGFGFETLTDNVDELNASMSNVPTIFKSTQAVWDATTLTTPGSVFNEARTVAHNTLELNINAPVYGVEDLDNHVRNLWESLAEEPVNRFGRTN